MINPVVTVVTVVLNSEQYIEQTINSVTSQSYQRVEYIVIDGGSSDGTLEIIERYRSSGIDYLISEPDQGIADAMNKALIKANGDYIIFLHADDYFTDAEVLATVFNQLKTDSEIILCDILFGRQLIRLSPRGLNFWINLKTGVLHQGAICKRTLFEQIGGFDCEFKIAMDYDFFLRAYRVGIKTEKIPIPLSVMRDCGVSSRKNWSDLLIRFSEEKKVHLKNTTTKIMSLCYIVYWALYIPYRRFGRSIENHSTD